MTDNKYTMKRTTKDGVKQIFNTITGCWGTYVDEPWNVSLWNSIKKVEEVTINKTGENN